MFGIDDFLIAAAIAAASAGGSAMLNNAAANKVAKQQNLYTQLEEQRQDALRGKAQQGFKDLLSTQDKGAQDTDMATQTAALSKAYNDQIDPNSFQALLPGQGNASNTVRTDIVNSGNAAEGKTRRGANSKAVLDAYGRVGLNNDIQFAHENQSLNDIASQSKGSSAILPLELNAAQNKGASLRGWANALSTAGSIASSIAAGNAFSSALNGGTAAASTVANAAPSLGTKISTFLKGGQIYGNIPGSPGTWVQAVPLGAP